MDERFVFKELVDISKLEATLQKFSRATGFTTGLVSFPDQELLIATGWRDICTKFHRVHPDSSQHCKSSNLFLTSKLRKQEKWNICLCENGLIDAATPILLDGQHVASLFTGQIFLTPPDPERFRQQALQFGFDVDSYLEAVKAVPIVSEDQLRTCLDCLGSLAVMIAEQGITEMRLKHNGERLENLLAKHLRIEKELEEEKTNLRITLHSIGDGVISTDIKGRITRINSMATEYTGWSAEEAIGQPLDKVFRIVHSHNRSPCNSLVDEVLSGDPFVEQDRNIILISKNGSEYRIADSAAPIRDNTGITTGVVLVFRDISEEYRIRDDLVQERDFSNSIVKNTATFIVSIAPDGMTRFINPAGERIGEYSADEVLGKNWWTIFYPGEQYRQVEKLLDIFQDSEIRNYEMTLTTKSGEQRILSWNSHKRFDAHGRLTEIIGLGTDITERKRTEKALEKRIVALTQPLDDTSAITFEDLFNIDDIQKLQEEFSTATGVASIITHTDGSPITKPSNFCRLCNDIIRKTEIGITNCYKSDAVLGRFNEDGPIVQPCLSGGLWDAGASISVGGKHIANWLIGQVRDKTQNEENMLRYAREIGADEKEFLESFREVPEMSQANFERISQFLFTLANQLSTAAYQNVQQSRSITKQKQAETALQRQSNLEKLISEISTRFINLPVDAIDKNIETALQQICRFVQADAGYLFEFDQNKQYLRMTHLWQSDKISIDKNALQKRDINYPTWWNKKIFSEKKIRVYSVSELPDEKEKGYILPSGVNSIFEIALTTKGRNTAVMGFASHEDKRNWTDEEGNLLNMAGQVFVNGLMRQRSERERQNHIAFLQHLDNFDTAIRDKTRLEDVLRSALECILEIFDCDRSYVCYPVDPHSDHYFVPMLSAKKEYLVEGLDSSPLPINSEVRRSFSKALIAPKPHTISTLDEELTTSYLTNEYFVQSQLFMAMFPTVDRPWLLGLHQCTHPRDWSENEQRLFQEIARRFQDSLNASLILQNLQNNQRWLFTTLSSVADPVLTTNSDGEIIFMNEAARAFSGRTFSPIDKWNLVNLQEAQGLCLNDVLDLRDISGRPLSSPLTELIENKHRTIYETEALAKNHQKEDRIVILSGSRIRDNDNQIIGMVLVLRDITEQRSQEASLRHQQKLEAIGTLAGGVAHEINNPIGIIMNYAQLILDDLEPDSTMAQDAAMIVSESRRIAEIVKNLLSFSRQDMESHSPANLNDILHSTLNLTHKILSKFNIVLDVDAPDEIPKIKCRSQQIMQVLMNLITNAKDALNDRYPQRHENKRIRIQVSFVEKDGEPFLRTCVRDWGGGIPKSIEQRIFDPFFTSKQPNQGTGLGLSVSHGIVKDHGGKLWFENIPGEGVQFFMDLPIDNGWELDPILFE